MTEVVATSTSAEHEHDRADEDLLPLEKLIRQTLARTRSARPTNCAAMRSRPTRNSANSSPSSPRRAMPTLPEPSSPAVVLDTDVASRSFKGLLPPRLSARPAGRQPLLTFVTIGELTQWAKLRRWGPRNRGMLDS